MFVDPPFLTGAGFLDIGLTPIEPAAVFTPAVQSSAHYQNKIALKQSHGFDVVSQSLPESYAAQRSLAEFMRGEGLEVPGAETCGSGQILWELSLSVCEDICILLPGGDSHYLAAASLCAPSGWSLQGSLGKRLEYLHAPVPDLNAAMAGTIKRLLDRLSHQKIFTRGNWAIKSHPELAIFPDNVSVRASANGAGTDMEAFESLYLRVERQCLFKLPVDDAIVFSILVTIEPVDDFLLRTNAHSALLEALRALTQEQLAYKGMTAIADALGERLLDVINR